jgi:hypothetical protein
MYLGSIHEKVWEVTEKDYAILDPNNLTPNDRDNRTCNRMALNTIYNGIDSKVFEGIKDLEFASKVWTRLSETYEGTKVWQNRLIQCPPKSTCLPLDTKYPRENTKLRDFVEHTAREN